MKEHLEQLLIVQDIRKLTNSSLPQFFLKKGDDALAKIRVQAQAPTSNIVGAIYKGSKLITDVAAMGILDTLQEKND